MKSWDLRLFIYLSMLALAGCGSKAQNTTGSSTTPTNPPIGEVSQTGMAIYALSDAADPDNELYKSHISLSTDYTEPCFIDATTSSQDISCYVDVPEYDLYFHGVSYNYNIPADMCAYLGVDTIHYFNFEVGVGPTAVEIVKDYDGSGNLQSTTCTTSETGVSGPDPVVSCTSNPEVTFNGDAIECIYDHSKRDDKHPNCCFGNYELTETKTTMGVQDETETHTVSWGGNYTSCINGPYPSGWPVTSKGIPRTKIISAKKGLNEVMTIPGPIFAFNAGSNTMVANRYTPALHSHDGYYVARTSTKPYAFDPVDDRNGTDLRDAGYIGNDAYTFYCLNEGFEVLNRIRIYTREWNTNSEFLEFLAESGASGDPDAALTEPCDGVGMGGDCNDIYDWDDYGNDHPNYPTDPLTTLTSRRSYFPQLVP